MRGTFLQSDFSRRLTAIALTVVVSATCVLGAVAPAAMPNGGQIAAQLTPAVGQA